MIPHNKKLNYILYIIVLFCDDTTNNYIEYSMAMDEHSPSLQVVSEPKTTYECCSRCVVNDNQYDRVDENTGKQWRIPTKINIQIKRERNVPLIVPSFVSESLSVDVMKIIMMIIIPTMMILTMIVVKIRTRSLKNEDISRTTTVGRQAIIWSQILWRIKKRMFGKSRHVCRVQDGLYSSSVQVPTMGKRNTPSK